MRRGARRARLHARRLAFRRRPLHGGADGLHGRLPGGAADQHAVPARPDHHDDRPGLHRHDRADRRPRSGVHCHPVAEAAREGPDADGNRQAVRPRDHLRLRPASAACWPRSCPPAV
ncbi:MAG: hypothetical protein WDM92_14690 [Caulobacteraceae bacterium]